MTKRQVMNIVASVRERLLNRARDSGRPFGELLQYYAMERFLYRLSRTPDADEFVLKGALMFAVWQAPLSRPTMDIDLLGRTDNSIDTIVRITKDACLQGVEPDGLEFDEASVEGQRITEAADYEGVRVRFRGVLGTARIVMQLDVGFGDVVIPRAKLEEYPTILPGLPAPRIRGYSRESTIAEKFEAMVKLGILNSRMKDFFDIWFLSREFDFDGQILAAAITKTFTVRGAEIPSHPARLTGALAEDASKTVQWRGFTRRSRLEVIPGDFGEVMAAILAFLGPVAESLANARSFQGTWEAPGPWRW